MSESGSSLAPAGTAGMMDSSSNLRRQIALLKAGALQNAILTSPNFSIIATDEKGIIQLFNVGAERMLGYLADEVVNRISPSDMHDPDEVTAHAETLSRELATSIAPGFEALAFKASRDIEDIYELTYIRKDGGRFPAVVSITALRDDGGIIIGYLLIGTDNSERKRVELAFKEAMAAAEKANHAKSDFLSGMSHELRTPLNAILGFAQLLDTGTPAPTATQKRSIDQILNGGWYLLELINEILDLVLIESGNATLSREPVSLAEVMLECRAMIEPQAHTRGITMAFPHFDIACFVNADRTRLKQVLINLLFNAVKYNRPGGTVTLDCSTIRPEVVRISVRDTGAGLTPEQLAQLFQPFNRLGREGGAEEGTGIGLMVTKRLVELMEGAIGVTSAVGAGSVFWVELKVTVAPQLGLQEHGRAAASQPPLPDGRPLRTLLYVEDNPANLELVEQLIARRPDLRLLSAADGDLGVEYARVYQPEVILMDINLPGISGIEAMTILRADPSTAHIPIIALSANAVPRDIEAGIKAEFFNYLTKPIKVDQFMAALVFDRFHIMQHVGNGVGRVRKQEHKALLSQGDDTLTRSKYLWLYNPASLPEQGRERFAQIKHEHLQTGRAWALKEALREFWSYRTTGWAKRFWDRWYFWATHSRLPPMIEVARMIARHRPNVLTYFKHPVTNAVAEGLNSKIATVQKRACGFRNRDNFKIAVYFHCGGLNLYPARLTHSKVG